jgi:DNA-binding GntR family transcriptional regulator
MVMSMDAEGEDRHAAADLVDQVYEQLLTLLRQRGLPAPETLNVASLASELGVSRTPVSMALVRMECDGLVRKLPGGGWITAEFTITDLDEVFELREVLDTFAMQEAMRHATPEDIAALYRFIEQMQEAADARDIERWMTLDQSYSNCLLNLTGNTRLQRYLEQLHSQLYRMMLTNLLVSHRMLVSTQEHRAMTEAIASGDADAAVKQTLNHLFGMKTSLLDIYDNILQPLRGQ